MKRIYIGFRNPGKLLLLLLIALYGLEIISCSYPIKLDAKDPGERLVVEGSVTTQNESYKVRLSYTAKYQGGYEGVNLPVKGALVSIVEKDGEEYFMEELYNGFEGTSNGYYATKKGQLIGQTGKSYKLRIKIAEKTYESEFETITPAIPIDSLYYEFKESSTFEEEGFKVYVNITDPKGQGNYYKWTWKKYEKIYVCGFIYGSGGARMPRACCEPHCFNITSCYDCNNVISDTYVDGNGINKKLVASIPYNGRCNVVIEVRQQIITKRIYDILTAVNKQNDNSGSIFDTPPFPIESNIRNVNDPDEVVFGYFAATGEVTRYIRLERSLVPRPPTFDYCEKAPGDMPAPPCETCVESETRTAIAPPEWKE